MGWPFPSTIGVAPFKAWYGCIDHALYPVVQLPRSILLYSHTTWLRSFTKITIKYIITLIIYREYFPLKKSEVYLTNRHINHLISETFSSTLFSLSEIYSIYKNFRRHILSIVFPLSGSNESPAWLQARATGLSTIELGPTHWHDIVRFGQHWTARL